MEGQEATERAPQVLARNPQGEKAVGVVKREAPHPSLDAPSKGGPWGYQHLSGQELSLLEDGGGGTSFGVPKGGGWDLQPPPPGVLPPPPPPRREFP